MRQLRALGSAIILLALIVGIPLALNVVGAGMLPSNIPTWEQIKLLLTNPLSGDFLVGALIVLGWIAWATFTVAVLIEAAALLRGRTAPRLPALGAQQRLAAVLLAAIALGLAAGPTAATAAPADHGDTTATISITTAGAQLQEPSNTEDPTPTSEQDQQQDQDSSGPAQVIVEVQPGDTLWDLAATHLDDGHRWREIADLNYGIPQPDGGALTDSHWIEPGWQLQIPLPQQPDATVADPDTDLSVTVQAGDTLYDLAEEHLGDGDRYPEIVQASLEIEQPDGSHLTDPDLIRPGWTVLIPGADQPAGQPAEDAAQEQPANEFEPPRQPATGPTVDDASTPPAPVTPVAEEPAADAATSAAPEAASNEEAADAPGEEDESGWAPTALHTTGGVGSLLAASLAAALLLRRRRVARTSPPGTRLPAPAPATQQFQQELRAVADPIGRDSINIALRDLAAHAHTHGQPAPPVLFVRYAADGTELQLYLDEPTSLPHPWAGSDDKRIWSITNDDLADHVRTRTDADDVPAAYPALVGIGLGDQDAHLLADLERLQHLDLRGDHDTARGVMSALLLELVTSDWADDLQVTIAGDHDGLADALASPRVLHLPTATQALDRAARVVPSADDTATVRWPPEIIFLASTAFEDDDSTRLAQLLAKPTPGLAFVTLDTGIGNIALDLQANSLDATLQPSGMPVQVQHLAPAEYDEILTLLNVDHVPGPDWTTTLAQAREPDPADLPPADLTEELPDLTEPETLFEVEHTSPHLRLLGPVELVGADTSVLSGTIGHLHAAVEMAAYLCLHDAATADELTAALWPSQRVKPATRHSAISRTRRLLGTTPDGNARLEGHTTGGASSTTYYLADVGNDWADFTRLHGPDPTQTPLPDLRRALLLVRGTPFSQVRDGAGRVRANRYLWSDALAVDMTASIVDIACETARRALLDGKPRLAAEAADAGLRATTDHERLWRYAITARLQIGEHDAAAELATQLTQRLTQLDVDPEPETNTLLDHATNAAQAAS